MAAPRDARAGDRLPSSVVHRRRARRIEATAVHDEADAAHLPDAEALEEWFLATACPECGVIDDPTVTGPTP